jgi:hypothetical protein
MLHALLIAVAVLASPIDEIRRLLAEIEGDLMAWDTTPTRVCEITIPAAQVGAGGVTDFTVLLNEDSLPAEIFTEAKADGADIRAALASDGTGLMTVDVILFDAGSETALLAVGPVSLSAAVSNSIWLSYGDAGASAQTGANAYAAHWAGYWPMSEGSGGSVADRVAGNTGTINGASWTTGAGIHDDGLGFVTDDYVDVGDIAALDLSASLSVICWAAINANQTGTIVAKGLGGESDHAWDLKYHSAPESWRASLRRSGGQINVDANATVAADGTRYHVALTWDGTTAKIFHNTTQSASQSVSSPLNTNNRSVRFGGTDPAAASNADKLNGAIASLALFDEAVSAAWVTTNYNNTSAPGSFATAGTPGDVVGGGGISIPVAMHYRRMMSR